MAMNHRIVLALGVLFPGWANRKICADAGLWNPYFAGAEAAGMEREWNEIIWPVIKNFDFDTVLELAPGAGRNTARLAELARIIHAVDINRAALDRLERRFSGYAGPCRLHFHRNDGRRLPMIQSNSITAIYCWDSAVHFDRRVIQEYVREFARILRAGGKGFVHHSNLGSSAGLDFMRNPQCRSNMSKELFRDYCDDNRLAIIEQIDLPWPPWEWEDLPRGVVTDCLSVFSKGS